MSLSFTDVPYKILKDECAFVSMIVRPILNVKCTNKAENEIIKIATVYKVGPTH
jgi:hypothetical protein